MISSAKLAAWKWRKIDEKLDRGEEAGGKGERRKGPSKVQEDDDEARVIICSDGRGVVTEFGQTPSDDVWQSKPGPKINNLSEGCPKRSLDRQTSERWSRTDNKPTKSESVR